MIPLEPEFDAGISPAAKGDSLVRSERKVKRANQIFGLSQVGTGCPMTSLKIFGLM
jgi:hypothetical protein